MLGGVDRLRSAAAVDLIVYVAAPAAAAAARRAPC